MSISFQIFNKKILIINKWIQKIILKKREDYNEKEENEIFEKFLQDCFNHQKKKKKTNKNIKFINYENDKQYEENLKNLYRKLSEIKIIPTVDKPKFILIPPKVYNFNKKTCIANYVELISKHKSFFNLQNFILEELYTIHNLDFKNRLILKGKFN